jgi:two-component system, cell cycle sensor histidine kinase and response regulator CckA
MATQPRSMFDTLRAYTARVKSTPDPVRVLVVDDDANIRAFVERALCIGGMTPVTAAGGHEALIAAQTTPGGFDLVVTDVRMPHMSGPQFIDKLRRTEPYVKVLYLTGFNDQLFKEKIALWEDEAFLDKPCTIRGLLEAISLLLHGQLPPEVQSA